MRRILNLNDLSTKFLIAIALLVGAIPLLLWLCSMLVGAAHLSAGIIPDLIKISLIMGGLLFVVFLTLILLEQVQDNYLHRVFLKGRGKRIRLSDEEAECPYCGHRQVRDFEKRCSVCDNEL